MQMLSLLALDLASGTSSTFVRRRKYSPSTYMNTSRFFSDRSCFSIANAASLVNGYEGDSVTADGEGVVTNIEGEGDVKANREEESNDEIGEHVMVLLCLKRPALSIWIEQTLEEGTCRGKMMSRQENAASEACIRLKPDKQVSLPLIFRLIV